MKPQLETTISGDVILASAAFGIVQERKHLDSCPNVGECNLFDAEYCKNHYGSCQGYKTTGIVLNTDGNRRDNGGCILA